MSVLGFYVYLVIEAGVESNQTGPEPLLLITDFCLAVGNEILTGYGDLKT